MAVATTGTNSAGFVTGAASLTFSHTVPAGADCLVVFGGVNWYGFDASGTCTWNGTGMTKQVYEQQGNLASVVCFYLLNPEAGTYNIVLTPDGYEGSSDLCGYAVNLSGVHQTTPVSAGGTDTQIDAGVSNATNLDVASETDGLVLDYRLNGASIERGWTIGGDLDTEIVESGLLGGTVEYALGTAPGAATVQTSWTVTGGEQFITGLAIAFDPAGVGGGVVILRRRREEA